MLSNRQLKILDYYLNNLERFISSKEIANFFNISVRTVKNELSKLRQVCSRYISFELVSIPGKGTTLRIIDSAHFLNDIKEIKQQEKTNYRNHLSNRVNTIIKFLLDSQSPTTKYEIITKFYISETTLYNHINEIKNILKKFNLSLKYTTNIGYEIIGKELDKRTCIAKIGLDYEGNQSNPENKTIVYNVVADAFIKYQYHIDEETLQNITDHVFKSLQRIKRYHYMEKNGGESLVSTKEYKIANEILANLIGKNTIKKSNYINEIYLLTQIIMGKLKYVEDSDLKVKTNDFIDSAFESINQKFAINFNSVENLRLLLVLHLVPLFYRVKSGTQLINPMEMEIHKSFPQAYDIALYFSLLVEDYFQLTVSNNEISYLALYFNYGIDNYLISSKGKKILIVTSLRKSETILLQHEILSRFPKQIESIDFINKQAINQPAYVNNYDAIFTTEESFDKYQNLVPYINLFPDENDLKKIDLAINGYTEINDVLDKFNETCFFSGKAESKEQVLNIVTEKAIRKYQLNDDFLLSIVEREKLSSTYFGNSIAVPHPLTPMSNKTFVSLAIIKDGIKWDNNNLVNIIMLVSIEKSNPKELQFWYYISSFIENKNFTEQVLKNPTFDNFINIFKLSLMDKFK